MIWKTFVVLIALFLIFMGIFGAFLATNEAIKDAKRTSGKVQLAEIWYYEGEAQPRFPGRVGRDPDPHLWIRLEGEDKHYQLITLDTKIQDYRTQTPVGSQAVIYYTPADQYTTDNKIRQLEVNDKMVYSLQQEDRGNKILGLVFLIPGTLILLFQIYKLVKYLRLKSTPITA